MSIGNNTDLTKWEEWSFSVSLAKELSDLNEDSQLPVCGPLGARFIGALLTPLTAAIDAVGHTALFAGKLATGTLITPYNFFASKRLAAPRDLEISSALVHLIKAVDSLFRIVYLPVLMLFSPTRAYALIGSGDKYKQIAQTHTDNYEGLKRSYSAVSSECQNLRARLGRIQLQLSAKMSEVTNLQNQLKLKTNDYDQKKEEVDRLNRSILGLRRKIAGFKLDKRKLRQNNGRLVDVEKKQKAKLQAAEMKIEGLEAERDEAMRNLALRDGDIQALNAQVASQQEQVRRLNEEVSLLKDGSTSPDQEKGDRSGDAEQRLRILVANLKERLAEKNKKLESDSAAAEGVKQALDEQVTALRTELATHKGNQSIIADYQKENEERAVEIDKLRNQVAKLQRNKGSSVQVPPATPPRPKPKSKPAALSARRLPQELSESEGRASQKDAGASSSSATPDDTRSITERFASFFRSASASSQTAKKPPEGKHSPILGSSRVQASDAVTSLFEARKKNPKQQQAAAAAAASFRPESVGEQEAAKTRAEVEKIEKLIKENEDILGNPMYAAFHGGNQVDMTTNEVQLKPEHEKIILEANWSPVKRSDLFRLAQFLREELKNVDADHTDIDLSESVVCHPATATLLGSMVGTASLDSTISVEHVPEDRRVEKVKYLKKFLQRIDELKVV